MNNRFEDFREFVNNKIKDYTEKEKEEYFNTKEDSALSQYNIDYLNFYKRDKITELGESKFF